MAGFIDKSILQTQLEVEFDRQVNAFTDDSVLSQIVTPVMADTESADMGGLLDIQPATQNSGEAPVGQVDELQFSGTSLRWTTGLKINQNDIEGHVLGGQLRRRIAQLGSEVARAKMDDLADNELSAFETTNSYDGQAYFDTDHPITTTTQSNDETLNVASTDLMTQSEAQSLIDQALNTLTVLRSDTGRYVNAGTSGVDRLIMFASVPQARILKRVTDPQNQFYDGGSGATNTFAGAQHVVVANPNIANAKIYSFAMTPNDPSKAIYRLEFRGPRIKVGEENVRTDTYDVVASDYWKYIPGDYTKAHATTLT